jgi:hypothetical protein
MTTVHQFPDGTEFVESEFTLGGKREGHTASTGCRCLPWLFVRDVQADKLRVVHVPGYAA